MSFLKFSVSRRLFSFIPLCLLFSFSSCRTGKVQTESEEQAFVKFEECDVVIAGGSTAALAAALASADQKVKTCLIEPTNWAGGQMTASGVPAIDFAHHAPHKLNLHIAAANPINWNQHFKQILGLFVSNPGKCWVSTICYEPAQMIANSINPAIEQRREYLTVYFETVVKSVVKSQGQIAQLIGIKRKARNQSQAYTELFSNESLDWYSYLPSANFKKEIVTFRGYTRRFPVVIDATEFGDVLVLSGANFLQGVEVDENSIGNDDKCGQAIVYPFVLEKKTGNGPLNNHDTNSEAPNLDQVQDPSPSNPDIPPGESDLPNFYSLGKLNWDKIWTYRRISAKGAQSRELSLQNWNPGNDYPGGYFLKSKADTLAEASKWFGGLDRNVLRRAEDHSYGWARYYSAQMPPNAGTKIEFARDVFDSGHGFSKMPYIRDTRRSVGNSGFLLKFSDLNGTATNSIPLGTPFPDRIAIGAYIADFHNVMGCPRRAYLNNFETLPYFIPFRALTNETVPNLLVAGKTMAQTFHANGATRLQPVEWNSGAAAGLAGAYMTQNNIASTVEMQQRIEPLQAKIKEIQPLNWTIDKKTYPSNN